MKRMALCLCIIMALCALITGVAAEPLDFSLVAERNGRVTGEIYTGLPLNNDAGIDTVVYIDCAAPQPLTDAQWVRLQTEFWKADKAAFAAALQAAGVHTENGALSVRVRDPLHRGASYREAPDVSGFGCENVAVWTREMHLAADAARRLFDSLGLSILIHSAKDYGRRHWPAHGYAPDGTLLPDNQATWLPRFLAKEAGLGRDPSDYVLLGGVPTLRGLPVGSLSYPDGDAREPTARCGISCAVSVFARKDGRLVNVVLEGVPLEVSAQPLPGAQPDWRDAFERLNAQLAHEGRSWFYAYRSDTPQEDGLGTMKYATRNVLTAIAPVWMGLYPNELVPGYRFTVETRRLHDDVCVCAWSGCVDMEGEDSR